MPNGAQSIVNALKQAGVDVCFRGQPSRDDPLDLAFDQSDGMRLVSTPLKAWQVVRQTVMRAWQENLPPCSRMMFWSGKQFGEFTQRQKGEDGTG